MKPKYFHEFLGERIDSSSIERSRGSGLNRPCTLEKWKISVFESSTTRPNFFKKIDMTL